MNGRGGEAPALRAALDGDREAWAEIVDRYEQLIWWVTRSHGLDEATAADVVQTVWLTLLQRGSSINDPSRLGAWLSTTAKRETWARLKKQGRELPTEFDEERLGVSPAAVDADLLIREEAGEALDAFRRLSAKCQELLHLVCADPPIGYAEIAARLGRPTGSIGPTRARCLDQLRTLLAQPHTVLT